MDRFRIYYADGSAFGSEEGTWDEAPLDGVILVAVQSGERTDFFSGTDQYAKLDGGTVAGLDELGPTLRQHCPWIKHGVWTTHAMYERIQQRAREEFGGG